MAGAVTTRAPEMAMLLNSKEGPVGQDMMARGERIAMAARMQAGSHTGALKASIHVKFEHSTSGSGPIAVVGSPLSYALMHHDGTKPHVIVPRFGGKLKFSVKGVTVYADKAVQHGIKPNKFLGDNLELALIAGHRRAVSVPTG